MMPAASAQPRIHHRRFLMVRRVADSLGPAAKVSVCTLHSLVTPHAGTVAVTIEDPIGSSISCEGGHKKRAQKPGAAHCYAVLEPRASAWEARLIPRERPRWRGRAPFARARPLRLRPSPG